MIYAKSEIVLLCSAAFRRYEQKYSAYPYSLYKFTHDDMPETRAQYINDLLATPAAELDPYTRSFRRLFPTAELLGSAQAAATVESDFSSHGYSTDVIERLHAEVTRKVHARSQGYNFTNLSRTSLLDQTVKLHVDGGAFHPLGTHLQLPAPEKEVAIMPAILQPPPPLCEDEAEVLPLEDDGGGEALPGDLPPLEDGDVNSGRGDNLDLALVPMAGPFSDIMRVVRPCSDALVLAQRPPHLAGSQETWAQSLLAGTEQALACRKDWCARRTTQPRTPADHHAGVSGTVACAGGSHALQGGVQRLARDGAGPSRGTSS